ncbi:MAG: hypothetical protein P8Y12_08290 [Gammaproteobacteria bacterium]
MKIASNRDIAGPHDHKLAALEKTIAYPIETSLYLSDPGFLLALLLLALTALLDRIIQARPSQRKELMSLAAPGMVVSVALEQGWFAL